jgi:hypothetical protein
MQHPGDGVVIFGATCMSKDPDQYSDQETIRRRDMIIKRMLATPPKPHSEMKLGKRTKKNKPSKVKGDT